MRAGIQQSVAAISAAACVVLASGAAVPAQAVVPTSRGVVAEQSTVVVRGLAFPAGRAMRLGLVGCESVYDRVAETPQAMIGTGPATAPAGERSLRYDLAGGNALGPLSYVSSVAQTRSAGLTAYAAEGTTGVVWAGYQEPADRHTGRVWFGRAEVVVPAGRWTRIEAVDLTYSWTKWDMYEQAPVADAPSEAVPDGTLADMVVRHRGDGAGFVMSGLGCDGNEFAMDALRLETAGTATTYDLEGLATTASMLAPPANRAAAGQPVELRGTLVDSTGAAMSGVTMILEKRVVGTTGWAVDQVVEVDGGAAVAEVAPEKATSYRWRFAERPMAEGSVSRAVTVEVATGPGAGDGPTEGPSEGPSVGPADEPSSSAGPSGSAAPSASAAPGASAGQSQSAGPSSSPSQGASGGTSPSTSPSGSASAGAGASTSAEVDPTPSESVTASETPTTSPSASATATDPS